METYQTAFKVLQDAIKDPNDPQKVKAAKDHPLLKKALTGVTMEDLKVLNKVSAASGNPAKCDQGGS